MDYDVLKLVLWIVLCLPVAVLGLYFFFRIAGEIIAYQRAEREARRSKKAAEERRKAFDEEYKRRRGI